MSYVARAVEETLVNALLHRDYSIGGAEITVFAYDDRLEITSPGGKVDGPLPQNADLEHVDSVRRDPVIAGLFQRMRFMEHKGSGLKLIGGKTAVAPNYEERFMPRFEDDDRTFRVIPRKAEGGFDAPPDPYMDYSPKFFPEWGR